MLQKEWMQKIKDAGQKNVEKADENYIRVMTSNVLHSRDDELPKKTWEDRVDLLSAVYLTYLPDFLGLQEVSFQQSEPFVRRLSSVYDTPNTPLGDFVNSEYHGTDYIQNHTPIFYNKHKYELIDSRYHIFPNDDMHSYQWGIYRSRTNPSQKFIHMNLHPHSNSDINMSAFVDAHRELVHLRRHYPSAPIFLTGDYNACYTEEQFSVLIDGLSMQSAMLIAEVGDGTKNFGHRLGSTDLHVQHTAIDHVTVTTDLCDVKLHRVLFDEVTVKGSDHCPMFIDVALK